MSGTKIKSDRATWIKGPMSTCSIPAARPEKPWRMVLLGAPGVGKGTQAELISERLGACQLSTGDVFRAARHLSECERTPAMSQAIGFMQRGELVPDETVLQVVRERVKCLRCRGGFLLDGFPRTAAQAQALDQILAEQQLALDAVISYELPIDQIVSRLAGRRTCGKCKSVYHVVSRPSRQAGVCDQCGGELIQRDDDQPEAIRVRMAAYESSTAPLASYYKAAGLLKSVLADGAPEVIFGRTLAAIGAVNPA